MVAQLRIRSRCTSTIRSVAQGINGVANLDSVTVGGIGTIYSPLGVECMLLLND